MSLSDLFKFTQGLGQKGHQIGRKVGDAIELIIYGMIENEPDLLKHLVVEDGVEGATSAKHKVEFAFYNHNVDLNPSRDSCDLFGIIECKKVGVEQTIKQSFKVWKSVKGNKSDFYTTDGYEFSISPNNYPAKWSILVCGITENEYNLSIKVSKIVDKEVIEEYEKKFFCELKEQALIVLDVDNELFVLGPAEKLPTIEKSINKCVVIEARYLSEERYLREINVDESLPGPQTPEKAKQASFVSLDVRKKVLGRFDKTEDKSFVSILVIGEAAHWEEKSRSMIRLCNDYNLIVPDNVVIHLFQKFEEKFGETYQDSITKTSFKNLPIVKEIVRDLIDHFDKKVLFEMELGDFVEFRHQDLNGSNRLIIEIIN